MSPDVGKPRAFEWNGFSVRMGPSSTAIRSARTRIRISPSDTHYRPTAPRSLCSPSLANRHRQRTTPTGVAVLSRRLSRASGDIAGKPQENGYAPRPGVPERFLCLFARNARHTANARRGMHGTHSMPERPTRGTAANHFSFLRRQPLCAAGEAPRKIAKAMRPAGDTLPKASRSWSHAKAGMNSRTPNLECG
jgi:hypothetical protein